MKPYPWCVPSGKKQAQVRRSMADQHLRSATMALSPRVSVVENENHTCREVPRHLDQAEPDAVGGGFLQVPGSLSRSWRPGASHRSRARLPECRRGGQGRSRCRADLFAVRYLIARAVGESTSTPGERWIGRDDSRSEGVRQLDSPQRVRRRTVRPPTLTGLGWGCPQAGAPPPEGHRHQVQCLRRRQPAPVSPCSAGWIRRKKQPECWAFRV